MDTGLGHGQGNTGRQGSEPGEGKTHPAAKGADGESEKAARRDGLGRRERGGVGLGGQARESGPIPDGARSSPVSGGGLRRAAPLWRHAQQGRIYCMERLLTHRRLGCRTAVTHCLEGG